MSWLGTGVVCSGRYTPVLLDRLRCN